MLWHRSLFFYYTLLFIIFHDRLSSEKEWKIAWVLFEDMIFLNNLLFCFNILKKCRVVFIKKTVEKEQFDHFEFLKQEACLDYFPLSNVVIFCNSFKFATTWNLIFFSNELKIKIGSNGPTVWQWNSDKSIVWFQTGFSLKDALNQPQSLINRANIRQEWKNGQY